MMYPLKALLVGCTEAVLPNLRRELSTLAVEIEGEYLNAGSGLAHILAVPEKKRLVIIETSSINDAVQLGQMNEAAIGQPILALVDPGNDPSLMVRAMRAGAAQVVRLPLQSEDFGSAMRRIAIQFGHSASQSRTMTVLGASEGCGVTTIALNLASEIGRLRNVPCLLGESAVAFGRLANYLSIQPQLTIVELLDDMESLDTERVRRALTKIEENLQVLVGSYREITPVELTLDKWLKLLAHVKQLADLIVIDGRYAYDELDFDLAAQSQQLVLVAKPTVPSLYNLKMLLEQFAQRGCLAQQFVVINQFVSDGEEFSARQLPDILGVPQVFTVTADAEAIRTAENCGKTLRKAVHRSPALSDITRLARAVLAMPSEPAPKAHPVATLFDHLAHSFHIK